MSAGPFIVINPSQAKRLAKTLAKARSALDAVGVSLVAIGVENMVEAVKKARKPRKPRADKPAKPVKAPKAAAQAAGDLTA